MTENKFYVYVLMDTRKVGPFKYGDLEFPHEPYYIGKGSGDRKSDHFKYAKRQRKKPSLKDKRTWDIIRDTYRDPMVSVISGNLLENDAFHKEIHLIKSIGRFDLGRGPLLNLTDGGDGGSGHIQSNELRELRSKIVKSWWENASEEERRARAAKVSAAKISKAKKKPAKKTRDQIQQERLNAVCESLDITCTEPYQGAGKKLVHECNRCGNIWQRLPGYTINGKHGCPECMKKVASSRRDSVPIVCPHCPKQGHPALMRRWHFDNCKNRGST
jgi:hypothetical protein